MRLRNCLIFQSTSARTRAKNPFGVILLDATLRFRNLAISQDTNARTRAKNHIDAILQDAATPALALEV